MKKFVFLIIILAIVVSLPLTFASNSLNNTTNLTKAIDDAKAQNKSIVLIFDQKNCVYCDMLKDDVLSDANVISKLNEKCIVVIVDINEQPELASKYKVFGTPTTVFLDSNVKEIGRIEGYVDAGEFLDELKGM